ncbi:MAG: hypothetical protein EA359_18260 [Balneolaceae bacterium]|nr:MAG: hypothetical protein EA359_18260 [Balneolaceae bacterium]
MESNRIYTEEEVAQLIRRAVELEATRSVSRDGGLNAGLTISELEQVAADAGIDPELIQRAAQEFEGYSGVRSIRSSNNTKIKRDEIVCEHWINAVPDNKVLDDLITELNHRYGTSHEDVSWWNKLWDDYAGKAKIRRTPTTLEWQYMDEWQHYTTRVLFQKRGEKFRIRVSKRQRWGMNWGAEGYNYWLLIPLLAVLAPIGGVLSFSTIGFAWPGIISGILTSVLTLPVINYIQTSRLNKHKSEVTDTANDLATLTLQLSDDTRIKEKQKAKEDKTIEIIEVRSDPEEERHQNESGRLRNNLR